MRSYSFITIVFIVFLFACKKEKLTNSNGVASSFILTIFPQHIGDTCYYHKDEMQITDSGNSTPSTTLTNTNNFYSTIVKDSILANGTVGKIWFSTEGGYGGTTNELVYYDSILSSYVIKPYNSLYPYPYVLKMPLLQNSSWLNSINSPSDTCKSYNVVPCFFNGSYHDAINVQRTHIDVYGSVTWYEYAIGDKGFYKIFRGHISVDGSIVSLTQTITLTKTNF